MADVSKVTASDGTTYDIKDSTARSGLSDKMDKANPTGTGSLSLNRMDGSTVGTNSVAEGFDTISSGVASHAEGNNTTASGAGSHSEGYKARASATAAHAEGCYTTASSSYSHAEGYYAEAKTNSAAHAEGYGASSYKIISSGKGSHAEGSYNDTSGSNTVGPAASGQGSHAEGFGKNVASGKGAHAEGGLGSTASGNYSHAEGEVTTASGQGCHAEGGYTTASTSYSHAEGFATKASSTNQHVSGKYNIEDTDNTYAEIIGNGTADSARSNARTLDWNGNETIYGNVINYCNQSTVIDATKANNNVSSDNSYGFVSTDKSGKILSNFRTNVMANGKVESQVISVNYDTSGNEVGRNYFSLGKDKSGNDSLYLSNAQIWRDAIFDCTPDGSAKDRLLSRLTKSGTNIQVLEYGGYFGGSQNKRLKITCPEVPYGKFLIFVHLEADTTVHDYEIFGVLNAAGTAYSKAHYGRTTPSWTNMTGTASTGTLTWGVTGTQIYSSVFAPYGSWYVKIIMSIGSESNAIPNVYMTNES